ncbi:MAG: type II toxin-antitoxin system HicA family toxin [Candidatus Endomicrobiellum trichonymphae]|uniref:type II toxin-antitoxin system HicA family toxin n=1 Tax=Endomicrobium trichonymphae TaxID=1408204 RepID=UPI0027D3FC7F|nr:MAG: type II toxin-antitoxin system HicA family toxin [Candidatus Endomicrobium trichonymphae]
MKQVDLIRIVTKNGAVFIRHGGNHDFYKNPTTGISEAIPRHREIKEQLAKKIIKRLAN